MMNFMASTLTCFAFYIRAACLTLILYFFRNLWIVHNSRGKKLKFT